MTRSGFISLTGRPNVGKSTLMNRILGEKVSITSSKPQTTRRRIEGVYTKDEVQMVFIDTPGILVPVHKLDEYMVDVSSRTIGDVDIVLLVAEAGDPKEGDLNVIRRLTKSKARTILAVNKIDKISSSNLIVSLDSFQKLYPFEEVVPVSARTGENLDELIRVLSSKMPEGPFFFPEDTLTDQPERQMAAELIREKVLLLTREEIPHGVAVMIDSFKEREDKPLLDISATIVCEKNSHKPILIGKGGSMLKKIGTRARQDMESLFGSKVNLQLYVKVRENWRDSDFLLKNYGFDGSDLS